MIPEEPSSHPAIKPEEKPSVRAVLDAVERAARPVGAWLTPLIVPPIVGLALIVTVLFDLGESTMTSSPTVASTALIVGAALILGSAALYVLSPVRYDHFFTDLRRRVQGQSGTRELPPADGPEL